MIRTTPLCTMAALLAFLLIGGSLTAHAQDDDIVEDDQAQAQGVNNVFVVHRPIYTEQMFNQWVFGNTGGINEGRKHIDAGLKLQMGYLERVCTLTPEQREKLHLAGEGDLKRFFDRYEKSREHFNAIKGDQNKLGEVFQEIQPLQMSFKSGIFGEGSIFAKSVGNTLSGDQAKQFEKLMRERRWFRYKAKVDLVVGTLDAAIGLTAEQRTQFIKLLSDEVEPPLKFGQWDYYAVLYQASRIPEDKLRPLFDPVQWRILSAQIQQARGMGPFLQNGGFVANVNKK